MIELAAQRDYCNSRLSFRHVAMIAPTGWYCVGATLAIALARSSPRLSPAVRVTADGAGRAALAVDQRATAVGATGVPVDLETELSRGLRGHYHHLRNRTVVLILLARTFCCQAASVPGPSPVLRA